MKVCILLVDREGEQDKALHRRAAGELQSSEKVIGSGVTVTAQEHRIEGLSRRVLPGLGGRDTEGCPDMVGELLVAISAG